MQVQTLKLLKIQRPTPASSHHLAEALCSMPNLTDLTLAGEAFIEEFFSALKAKASSIQVQTLELHRLYCLRPASSHHLAEALCSMPNLTDLTLTEEFFTGVGFTQEFYSALKAKASSIQGCFPQIRKGNFRFNGVAQHDLNSFLHTLTSLQSSADLDSSNNSDNSADLGSSNDSDNTADLGSSNDSDNTADLGSSNDSDNSADLGSSNDSDNSADLGSSNDSDNSADLSSSNDSDNSADANTSVTPDTLPRG
ncbi:probable serine/threonine-protein kinase DDB_G0291918 [Strongylocentrotus purpuratus]|uniref:Uncharacterized protein n=1 Tax=Strongylocentrotus purpuratus TaxID=7668 RepID=A0A7M7HHV3_STRPU|nr:probable serine/threonine-protein kinase DDB_G0291918 [Strongylocentrotus purpuratus]|eukprot:XP_011668652.1 PREDICTED: probable serine/threonine-protein kinase DDB_G0291918 [Strongylocentrotus purpuratus]